jgi:hypothetical protein
MPLTSSDHQLFFLNMTEQSGIDGFELTNRIFWAVGCQNIVPLSRGGSNEPQSHDNRERMSGGSQRGGSELDSLAGVDLAVRAVD